MGDSNYTRQYRYARIAKGLCPRCGAQAENGNISCQACRDKTKDKRRSGRCSACLRIAPRPQKALCERCASVSRVRLHANYHRLKNEVYAAYGGYLCVCCGETHEALLTLDHINNDGAEHRKETKKNAKGIYGDLKKKGYPKIMQVMCHNCNFGRYRNGGVCPHKEVKVLSAPVCG